MLLQPCMAARVLSNCSRTLLIGIVWNLMPRFWARVRASDFVSGLLNLEGMVTPMTFSGPRASAAIAATKEESIPPLRPMRTLSKPFFLT